MKFVNREQILAEMAEAARFEHPERQMRLTLECGHLRLMPYNLCIGGGIGFSTTCRVCSEDQDNQVSRLIVNQEETGVL